MIRVNGKYVTKIQDYVDLNQDYLDPNQVQVFVSIQKRLFELSKTKKEYLHFDFVK